MMSEELIEVFFEKQLYTFLQKADRQQRESFVQGLFLTKEEQKHMQTLCTFVDQGIDKDSFYKKFKHFKEDGSSREVFYFGPPDNDRIEQQRLAYRDLLHGKHVLLCGPALHVDKSSDAGLQDIDCVVRLNFDLRIPTAYHESCSVIHYHCCNGDFSVEGFIDSLEPAPNFLCFERGVSARLMKEQCYVSSISFRDVSMRYRALEEELGSPPSTGLLACYDLLSFDIQGLYLQGFSFFQTPYRENYLHSVEGERMHNGMRECRMIKQLIQDDPRIVVDTNLESLLESIKES